MMSWNRRFILIGPPRLHQERKYARPKTNDEGFDDRDENKVPGLTAIR